MIDPETTPAQPPTAESQTAQHQTARPRPGRPRSAQVDGAILDAAIEELVEHGFASMTIDRIATRAGVARTTVYRRWSSTATLCMEAIERIRERLPEPPGGTVRDDLVFLLGHLNRIITTTRFGQILPQLAAEARRRPDLSRVYWTTYLNRGRGVLAATIHRGIEQGLIAPGQDIEFLIDLFTGPVLHRGMWRIDTLSTEQLGYLVDTVLAGLRPA